MSRPRVGIVGGGILGTTLALRLTQAGARGHAARARRRRSAAWPARWTSAATGSTASTTSSSRPTSACWRSPTSSAWRTRSRFSPVGVGFFVDGEMHPFNGLGDFARFPPLSPLGRARLAWFVAQCQLRTRLRRARGRAARQQWLRRHCGDAGRRADLAAAAGLALRRPTTTSFPRRICGRAPTACAARARARGSGETMGCMQGGHERLIEAARRARRRARRRRPPRRRRRGPGARRGRRRARRRGRRRAPSRSTSRSPRCSRPRCAACCPRRCSGLLDAYPQRYLGVVCLVLKLQTSLLPYYSVNICEPTPITTVVETSHVVGTEHTDGLQARLPARSTARRARPSSRRTTQSIYERFTAMLRTTGARLPPRGRRRLDRPARAARRAGARAAAPPARRAGVARRRGPGARLGEPDLSAAAQRRLGRADGRGRGRGGGAAVRALDRRPREPCSRKPPEGDARQGPRPRGGPVTSSLRTLLPAANRPILAHASPRWRARASREVGVVGPAARAGRAAGRRPSAPRRTYLARRAGGRRRPRSRRPSASSDGDAFVLHQGDGVLLEELGAAGRRARRRRDGARAPRHAPAPARRLRTSCCGCSARRSRPGRASPSPAPT